MKLPRPFYRLPLRFDADRLAAEVAQFADAEWQRHPTGYAGNSAIRLISAEGGENDRTVGRMAGTAALARTPYIRQILDHFGVVWSRSRLMRLAPGAEVPEHADINYHWYHRVRLHIPVLTAPAVRFRCDDQDVHMAAGEAWLFDNWRRHAVYNGASHDRVHLVADTTGSAAFWERVEASASVPLHGPLPRSPLIGFDPARDPALLYEHHNCSTVLPPAEIEQLVRDLAADLAEPDDAPGREGLRIFRILLDGFCREWRLVWSLYADTAEGWPHYARLRDYLRGELGRLPPLRCASNGMDAAEVLVARVLVYALNPQRSAATDDRDRTLGSGPRAAAATPPPASPAIWATAKTSTPPAAPTLDLVAPVFIVAAPRSGSTLLFETLAQARGFVSVGGEAPGLTERLPQLRPGAPGVDSNRLTAAAVDDLVREHVDRFLRERLRQADGTAIDAGAPLRWIEKTPRNALRIPFLRALFPDARFVLLWRDPRENLASIIEAWNSGGWITYPSLDGWDGPWSLLLPPGWQALRGRPLAEIAAFQWAATHRYMLEDLATLPAASWTALSYADFLDDPAAAARRLCEFAGVAFDAHIAARVAAPLPLSQHTLSAPAADKWRRHAAAIEPQLDAIEPLWSALRALDTLR